MSSLTSPDNPGLRSQNPYVFRVDTPSSILYGRLSRCKRELNREITDAVIVRLKLLKDAEHQGLTMDETMDGAFPVVLLDLVVIGGAHDGQPVRCGMAVTPESGLFKEALEVIPGSKISPNSSYTIEDLEWGLQVHSFEAEVAPKDNFGALTQRFIPNSALPF